MLDFHEGEYIYINKPYGMSSFGALAHIRYVVSKRLGIKRVKIGHAGTLDPLATGVLVLCTGKKTKQIEALQLHTKEYRATLQLGATTASYDMEHPVDKTYPKDHITRELLTEALHRFEGDIMQTPPLFSAININGKRAYELGRKGADVELPAKPIHIDEIELLEYDDAEKTAAIRVVCGKGTYIRSLVRDIGEALDSGAYMTSLVRTKSGDISLEDCMDFDQFNQWFEQQEVAPYITEVQNPPGTGKKKNRKKKRKYKTIANNEITEQQATEENS